MCSIKKTRLDPTQREQLNKTLALLDSKSLDYEDAKIVIGIHRRHRNTALVPNDLKLIQQLYDYYFS